MGRRDGSKRLIPQSRKDNAAVERNVLISRGYKKKRGSKEAKLVLLGVAGRAVYLKVNNNKGRGITEGLPNKNFRFHSVDQ